MIDTITRWFEGTQYREKIAMIITNFVETMWLIRYTWTVEITYDRGGELLGHDFEIAR